MKTGPAARFLGADGLTFDLGDRLRGAFGGVFGGGIAAACLLAARSEADGRRPVSHHCTFLRTLPPGAYGATVEVVSSGRTATTVNVRLGDAAFATATFAEPAALHDFAAAPLKSPELSRWEEGWELPLPAGVDAPLMETLPLRITGMPRGGFAHAVRAPWDEPADHAEGATMLADYCAGLPVGAAIGPEGTTIPVPNPDLSLRFTGEAWGEVLVGVGRLARIDRGAAATLVEVWCGPDDSWHAGDERVSLLAVGLSSAVMLRRDGDAATSAVS